MRPTHYVDIRVLRTARNSGLPPERVMSMLFSALHYLFKSRDGQYAVDLPRMASSPCNKTPGHVLRVFSDSEESLHTALGRITTGPVSRHIDMAKLRIRRVDLQRHSGDWIMLSRARVCSRQNMERRLKDLDKQRDLPYINIRSKTNGNRYPLIFVRRHVESPEFGHPTSYGLSGDSTITVPAI